MPRVRVELPDRFAFATELVVRVTDVNYGGHLGNDAMLSLLHEARVRFLRHHGLSEANVGGATLVMTDAAVVYRAEAFAGDRLRVEVALSDPQRVGCDVVYRVTRPADGKLVAEAKTGIAFLDPMTRKLVRLPVGLYGIIVGGA